MPQQDILEWIDSVLPAEVRASVEYHIQANTNVAQPLIKQLQALRAQLRENAYFGCRRSAQADAVIDSVDSLLKRSQRGHKCLRVVASFRFASDTEVVVLR